jgi:cation:H+ antiporter
MKTECDLQGECRALYFHRTAESPQLKLVILQLIVSLVAIIYGASLFVKELTNISESLGVPALVVSLIITPFATELPEKFNSVMWMGRKKDTLALGNITGAMVFQSLIPVAIGMCFTEWKLYTDGDWHALVAVGTALLSGAILYGRLIFTKKGFGLGSLLFGGLLYAAFVGVTVWSVV